ncbi:MAG: glycosyltransferase family 2 protein [Oscillospiraceae bacterium]|jgi:cellulose synthase/poly-beta-1,6-N-acetylglucosamine synthase-like glycosyltransferase|nr:glycosyltransferase family 2 protein [Oscillospiraceae bacterium]
MFPWLENLAAFFSALTVLLFAYQGVFLLCALRRPKAPPVCAPRHRFALVVAARNEERVIGHLLDSLRAQEYPAALYSVFVIADNCDDGTAALAAAKGAKVYERRDLTRVGKGFALSWFFQLFLPECGTEYDAVGIFDADNLVDAQFLRVMNDQLCAGETAVMGYRDAKNPHDSWVSCSMSIGFWTQTRLYNLPRMKLGLSSLAGGTGYVFKTSLVADGWTTTTLGEDTQFTMQINAQGHRMALAADAVIYDEQPVDFNTSVRQRLRWGVASYQNLLACLRPLGRAIAYGPRRGLALDGLLYLLFLPIMSINTLVQAVNLFLQPYGKWPGILVWLGISAFVGATVCIVQGLLVLKLERKLCRETLKRLFLYPIFLLTTSAISVGAMFIGRLRWRPIPHKRDVSLAQLTETD